jgi:4-hydroxybenzoate polyprenyltransferase
VFSLHLLNRIQERTGAVRFNTPDVAQFYVGHRALLSFLGMLSAAAAVVLGFKMGVASGALLLGMMITGALYTYPLPDRIFPGLRRRSLKDLPGSKTPLVAAGWATCAALLPALGMPNFLGIGTVIAFLFASGMVFWRTALSDLLDIQGDRIVGRETIPILIGVRDTRRLMMWLLAVLGSGSVLAAFVGWIPVCGLALLVNALVFCVLFIVYKRRHLVDRLLFEGLTDGNLLLSGILFEACQKLLHG